MQAVDLAAVERRGDAELQLEPAIPDPVIRGFLLQNLVKAADGFVWRVNLAALAANMQTLLGFPPADDAAAYHGPTLFVAGARSRYIKPEHRPLIARLFPNAEQVAIAGAGHWIHAERPTEFLDQLQRFLAAG
jgi:pimeloyl-ACP methyl ester carboxylesterase